VYMHVSMCRQVQAEQHVQAGWQEPASPALDRKCRQSNMCMQVGRYRLGRKCGQGGMYMQLQGSRCGQGRAVGVGRAGQ
jgi:hypothetical protein